MNDNSNKQLEDVLSGLSVKELEGVLDALVLVAEYQERQPLQSPTPGLGGIYLVPPYGELIASGDMKCFAKPRRDDRLTGDKVLVSGKLAYGEMHVGEPVEVDVREFDGLFGDEHRVSRKERLQWWPEKETLYLYPVESFRAYAKLMRAEVRPGVQTLMDEVEFKGDPEPGVVDESKEPGEDYRLMVTIARTPEQAAKGFSNCESIRPDEGLLIPLKPTTGIWMKGTLVPLTVAFLDSDYKILSLIDLQPLDETVHVGPAGSTWALEASPAWFASTQVEIGDRIALP